MNTYKDVSEKIEGWKSSGLSKSEIVVNTANACIGWPYVYAGRGEICNPPNRRDRASSEHPKVVSECQVLNGSKSECSGCKWHPGGEVLFYDCRGFTYWLFRQVGITINGKGATSQYNDDSNWIQKGPIGEMPRDKVCCVFRYDNSTKLMEHTLLYDGNGNYIHCSGEVKKVSTSKYKATHYAIPKGMEGEVKPVPEPETTAVVYAENGKPVKMRAKPSTSCKTYWEIPCGTVVYVLKTGDEWTKINDSKRDGYMMTQFLKPVDNTDQDTAPTTEHVELVIPNLTIEQAQKLIAQYPDAYMTVG